MERWLTAAEVAVIGGGVMWQLRGTDRVVGQHREAAEGEPVQQRTTAEMVIVLVEQHRREEVVSCRLLYNFNPSILHYLQKKC